MKDYSMGRKAYVTREIQLRIIGTNIKPGNPSTKAETSKGLKILDGMIQEEE